MSKPHEPYRGRTSSRYWYLSEVVWQREVKKVSSGEHYFKEFSEEEKHYLDSGVPVLYSSMTQCAAVQSGPYKGWIAPFVRNGILPLSPLELLAEVAE